MDFLDWFIKEIFQYGSAVNRPIPIEIQLEAAFCIETETPQIEVEVTGAVYAQEHIAS